MRSCQKSNLLNRESRTGAEKLGHRNALHGLPSLLISNAYNDKEENAMIGDDS